MNKAIASASTTSRMPSWISPQPLLAEALAWISPQPRLAEALERYERAWRDQVLFELVEQEVSTVEPVNHLGPQNILPSGFSRAFMRAIPGVLTTGGILGTFVGLARGLAELADKIDQARLPTNNIDPQVLVSGITGMMGGMATAFLTSIVGITLALLWIHIDRKCSRNVQVACAALQSEIKRILPVVGDTELAMHRLRLANEQTQSLKTLSFDIGSRVSEGIDQSIQEHLVPQIDAMKDVVDQVARLTGESQVEGIEMMVQKFSEALGERLSDQFDNLAQTIEDICSWHDQIRQQVDAILQKVGDIVVAQDRMLNTAARSAELFQGSLGTLTTIHEHMNAVALSMEEVNRATVELQRNILGSTQEMSSATAAVRDSVTESATMAEALKEAVTTELAALAQLGETLRSEVEVVRSTIETVMRQFAEDCQAGVQQTFRQFDEHLGTVARTLSGTVSETNEQSREIGSAVAGLRQTVEELDQSLNTAVPVLESLALLTLPNPQDTQQSSDADTDQSDQASTDSSEDDDGRVVN